MRHIIWSASAIGIFILGMTPNATAQRTPPVPYAYDLPIRGGGCGGFSYSGDSMYLFEYDGRQLYEVSPGGRLIPREDVKGWYVVDVAVIDGKAIYCSRDRVFRKRAGKIEVNSIKNSEKLISIAADAKEIFLLDAAPNSTIIVLDKRTGQELRRLQYDGRNPVDVAEGEGHLWVLDRGDRCIHRVGKQTGKTDLVFQAGPGVEKSTNGLLFRDGQLYVHEGDYSRLRRVEWRQDGAAVSSWSYDVRMTFFQQSWNDHDRDASTVAFKVPIPPNRATQSVGEVTWMQHPSKIFKDRFGQPIAQFEGIRIPPKGEHVLKYTIDVHAKAVQYNPPHVPLSALEQIDPVIRRTYLASNKMYGLDNPLVQAAAREARKGSRNEEPRDVRTLIENIATYVIGRMSYRLDDTWNDAATALSSDTGSCSEYSFLFSALCRLNGVPTRLVGGLQIGDYGTPHETKGFHRWTEVWFPKIGWIPVDVTKIDGAEGSLDYEFLFGTPGYLLVLSEGDYDEEALGITYYIWRSYRGGKRRRNTYANIEPSAGSEKYRVVKLTK